MRETVRRPLSSSRAGFLPLGWSAGGGYECNLAVVGLFQDLRATPMNASDVIQALRESGALHTPDNTNFDDVRDDLAARTARPTRDRAPLTPPIGPARSSGPSKPAVLACNRFVLVVRRPHLEHLVFVVSIFRSKCDPVRRSSRPRRCSRSQLVAKRYFDRTAV